MTMLALDLGIGWQYDAACLIVLLVLVLPAIHVAYRDKVERLKAIDREEERDWRWPER